MQKNNERFSPLGYFKKKGDKARASFRDFKEKSGEEKLSVISDFVLNNAMYIIIITAIVVIAIIEPRFISTASVVNVISLTAAKLPIALGIGGAIVLSGTDISAGRAVGLTACIAASLLQSADYSNKISVI